MKKPKLLAPVGNREMLVAAINSGASAIYFGVKELNMRVTSKNFDVDELGYIVDYSKKYGVETNLTVNTIIFNNELKRVRELLKVAKEVGIDYVIAWDMAVISIAKEFDIPIAISTQASIANIASAKFYEKLGAKRIVLARECSLEMIKEIKKNVNIELETFIHGAMCISVSGRCFLSYYLFNRSAKRGECLLPS